VQTDGGAPAIRQQNYQSLPDMAMYDHIEILRGSDGLFSGTGEPGGTLNLVRKKPLAFNQLKTTTSAGSWDNYRQEVDVTGPLGLDGRLRGRGVVAVEDRDYFYDTTNSKKEIYYGILEADLTPDTLLTFGGSHQWRKIKGYWDSGLPRYNTGDDIGLSRDTSLGADWSTANYETNELFVKLEHAFNEDWKVNGSYTRYSQDITQNIGQATGTLDSTTGRGSLFSRWGRNYTIDQDLYDANVSGRFRAFGLEHEVLFGIDHQETRRGFESFRLGMANIPVDPRQDDISNQPEGAMPGMYINFPAWNQRKSGAYATLRAQLAEPLKLIVGARYSDYDDNITSVTPSDGQVYPTGGKESGVITPFGGLVYTLNEQWSVYTSYSQIYTPQTNYLGTDHQSLKPMTGDTYEVGTKAELFDKKIQPLAGGLLHQARERGHAAQFRNRDRQPMLLRRRWQDCQQRLRCRDHRRASAELAGRGGLHFQYQRAGQDRHSVQPRQTAEHSNTEAFAQAVHQLSPARGSGPLEAWPRRQYPEPKLRQRNLFCKGCVRKHRHHRESIRVRAARLCRVERSGRLRNRQALDGIG